MEKKSSARKSQSRWGKRGEANARQQYFRSPTHRLGDQCLDFWLPNSFHTSMNYCQFWGNMAKCHLFVMAKLLVQCHTLCLYSACSDLTSRIIKSPLMTRWDIPSDHTRIEFNVVTIMNQLTVLCEITIDGKDVQQSGQAQVIFDLNFLVLFLIKSNHFLIIHCILLVDYQWPTQPKPKPSSKICPEKLSTDFDFLLQSGQFSDVTIRLVVQ